MKNLEDRIIGIIEGYLKSPYYLLEFNKENFPQELTKKIMEAVHFMNNYYKDKYCDLKVNYLIFPMNTEDFTDSDKRLIKSIYNKFYFPAGL